jgi:hypothetical protein
MDDSLSSSYASFKSPAQIQLAPSVPPPQFRSGDTDSAAARFVSNLSELHLHAMMSDLVVEKNALAKVRSNPHQPPHAFANLHHEAFGGLGEGRWHWIRTAIRRAQLPRTDSVSQNRGPYPAIITCFKFQISDSDNRQVQMLHQGQQQTVASLRAQVKEAGVSGA